MTARPARATAAKQQVQTPDRGGAPVVVAVDGPSGSGKSTVARRVAQRLGLRYLDTGAMYRAVTWRALELGLDVHDAAKIAALADAVRIEVGTNPRRPTVAIDGVDVTGPIRSHEVTAAVSAVSAVPEVRARMVDEQRAVIGAGGIVVEGRDIGTTVAPEARVKVFLTASEEARAARRHRQVEREVPGAAVADTRAALRSRDDKDSSRATSPLTQPPDAIVVDSTDLPVGRVVAAVLDRCRAAGIEPRPVRRSR